MPEDYDFGAAIVYHDRVCKINLVHLSSLQLQRLASAMQEQFPALTHLMLDLERYYNPVAPTLPDGFLGGSTPRLQYFALDSIPFPALPKLLLSATDLARLNLWNIPHSGYFTPEAIVTGLAVSANLEYLTIRFESPLSRPHRESRRPPPVTRTVLPALTYFEFKGVSEYLEDLVARIDSPLLDNVLVTFFNQLIFDIPQLAQFMRRTTRFKALNEAHVDFSGYVTVASLLPFGGNFRLTISCSDLDCQLSSLTQIFTSFLPFIHMVEHLYIYEPQNLRLQWQDDIESMQWLEILHPFTAVKNLYVSKDFAQCIALALKELVRERVTEVLPAPESLLLEELLPSGHAQEAIGPFVVARQLVGHPVAVSHWNVTKAREALLSQIRYSLPPMHDDI